MNKLQLTKRVREGGGGKTYREWFDFEVDGQSLYELMKLGDHIGCLGWGRPEAERISILQLLRKEKSGIADGRVMLYVCPECGDIECGAVTVKIERFDREIRWHSFRFENNYDDQMTDSDSFKHIELFSFDPTEYWTLLTGRMNEIS